jgi:hypothetical protein
LYLFFPPGRVKCFDSVKFGVVKFKISPSDSEGVNFDSLKKYGALNDKVRAWQGRNNSK